MVEAFGTGQDERALGLCISLWWESQEAIRARSGYVVHACRVGRQSVLLDAEEDRRLVPGRVQAGEGDALREPHEGERGPGDALPGLRWLLLQVWWIRHAEPARWEVRPNATWEEGCAQANLTARTEGMGIDGERGTGHVCAPAHPISSQRSSSSSAASAGSDLAEPELLRSSGGDAATAASMDVWEVETDADAGAMATGGPPLVSVSVSTEAREDERLDSLVAGRASALAAPQGGLPAARMEAQAAGASASAGIGSMSKGPAWPGGAPLPGPASPAETGAGPSGRPQEFPPILSSAQVPARTRDADADGSAPTLFGGSVPSLRGGPAAGLARETSPGLLVALAPVALALAALALYQRIRRPDALRHPARAALHEGLKLFPRGASAGMAASAAGLPRKTAEYHLVYLARVGLVRTHTDAEGVTRYSRQALPSAPDLASRLLDHVRERPGATTAELAGLLGVSRARVDRRLKDLVLSGELEAERAAGERRYRLAMGA